MEEGEAKGRMGGKKRGFPKKIVVLKEGFSKKDSCFQKRRAGSEKKDFPKEGFNGKMEVLGLKKVFKTKRKEWWQKRRYCDKQERLVTKKKGWWQK